MKKEKSNMDLHKTIRRGLKLAYSPKGHVGEDPSSFDRNYLDVIKKADHKSLRKLKTEADAIGREIEKGSKGTGYKHEGLEKYKKIIGENSLAKAVASHKKHMRDD